MMNTEFNEKINYMNLKKVNGALFNLSLKSEHNGVKIMLSKHEVVRLIKTLSACIQDESPLQSEEELEGYLE